MTYAPSRRIVLVDDNPRDVELFTTACELGLIDGAITTFTDGRAALQWIGALTAEEVQAVPHLFVLDLNMPGISGFDLVESIRAMDRLRSARVLILTTSNSPQDRARCTTLGADAYLVKPTSFPSLIQRLREALGDPP